MKSLPDAVHSMVAELDLRVLEARPVPGGDICRAWQLRTTDGTLFAKTTTQRHDGMFAIEAAGLGWLDSCGARTPAVVKASADCLLLEWLPQTAPCAQSARALGRALADVHSHHAAAFGVAPPGVSAATGYIGSAPMVFGAWDSCADYLAQGRILPMARLAHDRGGLTRSQLQQLEAFAGHLLHLELGTQAAVVHGDLWSGNILWSDAGPVLIDPAAHGGHAEQDLAMLQLFGAPLWGDILAGYEARAALSAGWQQRVGLFQIYPLLVHAALFGGHYGSSAVAKARQYR